MIAFSPANSVLAAAALADCRELVGPLAELRQQAIALLQRSGLPSQRDEAWRFTNVRSITDLAFQHGELADQAQVEAFVAPLRLSGAVALPWVPGKVRRPVDALPAGVEFWSSRQLGDIPEWVLPCLKPEAASTPFAALNGTQLEEIWCFRCTGAAMPLQLIYPALASATAWMAAPRVYLVVESGARACLIESYAAEASAVASFTNSVSQILVKNNAELEHIRVSLGTESSRQVSTVTAQLERDSRYHSRVITLGGALTRTDLCVRFSEKGGAAELDGLYFASDNEQVDHHTLALHEVGSCGSSQKYKGLAAGNGQAVFDGIVRVFPGATGTTAHQQNRNLLLGENAVIHTKPHLEIENDDVICTHGATVGRLSLDEQFYLQARGIDPTTAQTLLTYAFASEIFDRISEPSARSFVRREFLRKLGNEELFSELG